MRLYGFRGLPGSSGVVISGGISPLIWVLSIVTLLITLLISTHDPPSRVLYTVLSVLCLGVLELGLCLRAWILFPYPEEM